MPVGWFVGPTRIIHAGGRPPAPRGSADSFPTALESCRMSRAPSATLCARAELRAKKTYVRRRAGSLRYATRARRCVIHCIDALRWRRVATTPRSTRPAEMEHVRQKLVHVFAPRTGIYGAGVNMIIKAPSSITAIMTMPSSW
jgi:hypothetical protein